MAPTAHIESEFSAQLEKPLGRVMEEATQTK